MTMGPLSLALHIALAWALLALSCPWAVDACSCMPPAHPQQYTCGADFVIVARVGSMLHNAKQQVNRYKVLIKKEFQMSEKAKIALKAGRIFTSSSSAACGIHLTQHETYLIVGHIRAGKPTISLCGYIVPWKEVSMRQRKGFRLLYKQGCDCEIVDCSYRLPCPPPDSDSCQVTSQCQGLSSVCTRHPGGKCDWAQNKAYKECTKESRRELLLLHRTHG